MKIIIASVFSLLILCLPAFSQNFNITEETFPDELSGLANLTINSIPEYSEIYIDSVYAGTTSTVLVLPPEGPHIIELVKPGFEDLEITFTAKNNTGLTIDAVLEGFTGRLKVNTVPNDAEITADGSSLIQGINILPIGAYTLKVSKDGWVSQSKTVRIYNDKEMDLFLELSPSEAEVSFSGAAESIVSGRHRFSSLNSRSSGLFYCPETSVLPQGGLQFLTGVSFGSGDFPFHSGIRAVFLKNLEISCNFKAFISLNYIEDTAAGGEISLKYNFAGPVDNGFSIAASVSGSMFMAAAGSPHNSLSNISISVPSGWIFSSDTFKIGIDVSPGLEGSFFRTDGTAVSLPVLRLLSPAGLFIADDGFKIGLSAAPDFVEFGGGFPDISGLSAAIEAGLKIPGTSSVFTIYGKLDLSPETSGTASSGLEAGMLVLFSN